ncbi:hypothetical protein [Pandoraea norimbergensis]|uniref:Uncharacterized protein n=1 Tax=Pandoraea norimbergensis TaxID=93219 RepID=A0ABN4JGS2_9BURK|nr:hypothetical protein [Pandoraea norimbergensis]ALS60062.1 hypothetical protein AT302_10100 [Pandoraea norimbergensis]
MLTGWPMACTLLLVSNIALPVAIARPRAPLDTSDAIASSSDVRVEPIHRALIKTDYSAEDVLKALASGGAPFANFAESVGDAYAVSTGHDIPVTARKHLRDGMHALDFATGMIPGVQLLRVPGDVAQLMSEELAGRRPDVHRVAAVLANSDLRGMEIPGESHGQADAAKRVETGPPPPDIQEAAPWRPALKPSPSRQAGAPSAPAIHGEGEFLQGYSQSLLRTEPLTHLLPGLVSRGNRFFLRGTHGDYRVQRSKVGDYWYVDAPQAGKPQVPVRFDPATARWYAYAPLRLCGGGCAQSAMGTPHSATDSIRGYVLNLVGIADLRVREAIQDAFDTLGELRLLRSNRHDLRRFRDNSITDIREVLVEGLRDIDPTTPLSKQQRRAAEQTAMYYLERPGLEAFCHENAEVLFHFMLARGVPKSRLRMVTLRPQNRPAHVMLLYTESPVLIKMLEMATPQPPIEGLVDGLTHLEFARAILTSRYRSRLFDPWSRIKMVTFERARSEREVSDMLAPTLEDAGYRRGEPYRISVTRPLGTPPQRQTAQTDHAQSNQYV